MTTPKTKTSKNDPEQLSFFSVPQLVQPAASAPLNSSINGPTTLAAQAPPQTAARAFGGYLYQIRYASLKALELSSGQSVGIEVLDDVDISGPKGQKKIQVKNEVTPLTDMNRGLWKALAHWAREIKNNAHSDYNTGKLIFATTAPIREGLPFLLSCDDVSLVPVGDRKKYVTDKIGTSEDKKLHSWIQQVKELDSRRLGTLLNSVRIVQEGDAEKLLEAIKGSLSFRSFRDESLASVAEQFEGWVFQTALAAFQDGNGVRISEEDIRIRIQNMRDQQMPKRVHFRHRKTKFDPSDRVAYRTCVFFRQLEEIGLSPEPIDAALLDYLRDQKERSDWAQSLEVGRAALQEYDDELFESWNHKFLDVGRNRSHLEEKANGLALYDQVLDSASPLLQETPPPRHVYRGSYHRLSNEPRIGWHPRWMELFKPADSHEDNLARQCDAELDGTA